MKDKRHDATGESAPLSEEQILAATVGERRVHDAVIHLAPYDPAWPSRFDRLAERVRVALEDAVLQLEHVGSTSVPGLAAKPIVDMVLTVADSADEPSYVPRLEAAGFVLRIREPGWFEHRLLRWTDPAANLHVFTSGCAEVQRMLSFRDWLRSNGPDRELYEATKRQLAARRWKYVQNYADAKSEVVAEILSRAMAR